MTTATDAIDAVLSAEHVGHAMHVGLVHCAASTPLLSVARIMAAHRIHAVVVEGEIGEDRLAVVSDLDLATALASGDADKLTAATAATTPLVTVSAADNLSYAAKLMARARATHALVVDRKGSPVGILSTLDLAEALVAD
jgi:CBS domain-containing protein